MPRFSGIQMTIGEDNWHRWVRRIDESTTAADRTEFLEQWKRPDSEVRILVTSPIDDDELVVPDVENVVIWETEDPARMYTRLQRMARMCGQQGEYLAISPTVKFMVEHTILSREGKRTEMWVPTPWMRDRERIFENLKVLEKRWGVFRLEDLADDVEAGEVWFEEPGGFDILVSDQGRYADRPTPEDCYYVRLAEWLASR
jgi:hypothetical protein